MSSEEAAYWLIDTFPDKGCCYVSKRTWKKAEQRILAEHFLRNIPHASARYYEALLSIMSVNIFASVVEKIIADNPEVINSLLSYYLIPSLRKNIKKESDKITVKRIEGIICSGSDLI